jgi:hypothetical protein
MVRVIQSIDGQWLTGTQGGGFVLPLSSGHITMITTMMKEATNSSPYLAIAEYSKSIAPWSFPNSQLMHLQPLLPMDDTQPSYSSASPSSNTFIPNTASLPQI